MTECNLLEALLSLRAGVLLPAAALQVCFRAEDQVRVNLGEDGPELPDVLWDLLEETLDRDSQVGSVLEGRSKLTDMECFAWEAFRRPWRELEERSARYEEE